MLANEILRGEREWERERESIAYGKPVDASERAGDKLRASRDRWVGLLA